MEFQDALNSYQQDGYTVVDPDDVTLCGQEISASLNAIGLPNNDQAGRILQLNLDKSVLGNTYVEIPDERKILRRAARRHHYDHVSERRIHSPAIPDFEDRSGAQSSRDDDHGAGPRQRVVRRQQRPAHFGGGRRTAGQYGRRRAAAASGQRGGLQRGRSDSG